MRQVSFDGVLCTRGSLKTFTWFNLSRVRVDSISPAGGPSDGGTTVTVRGAGPFANYGGGVQGVKCQFGTAAGSPVVPATLDDWDAMRCVTPPLPAGAASSQPVLVTLNGYADERALAPSPIGEASVSFRYASVPVLSSVAPAGGPRAGGYALTVRGSGFADDGGVACLFGDYQVTASVLEGGDSILCFAPPVERTAARRPGEWCAPAAVCADPAYAADDASAVWLSVTLNGNTTDRSAGLTWVYHQPVRLTHLTPWGGPTLGGTAVDVVGHRLLDYAGVLCQFLLPADLGLVVVNATEWGGADDAHGHALEHSPWVQQAYMHDGRALETVSRLAARRVRCTAPSLYSEPTVSLGGSSDPAELPRLTFGEVAVSVDGGRHWSAGEAGRLRYAWASPLLSALEPAGGPLRGGTTVTVRGEGFVRLGAEARCKFGNGSEALSVVASVDNSFAMRCETPAAPPFVSPAANSSLAAAVQLRVSLNGDLGDDALSAPMPFYLQAPRTALVLAPLRGPILGATAVTISPPVGNASFVYAGGTPLCRFGSQPPVDAALLPLPNATSPFVPGGAIGSLVCSAPRHEPSGSFTAANRAEFAEIVPVEISLNGQQFTSTQSEFVYVAPGLGHP